MRERYVSVNGIRLYAVEQGSGPAVLLLHGFPEHSWAWRHQLPALADAGYRAVAVDLPGYGRSDKPDRPYDEAWVNSCLAALVPAIGATKVVIVGHDWGGLLAWPFSRRHPELLSGVVGLNTPDLARPPMPIPELLRQIFPDQPPYIVQFQERGPAEWILGRDPEAFVEAMFRGPATVRHEVFTDDVLERFTAPLRPWGAITPPLEYYRAMGRNWEAAADLPAQVSVPALMISATGDPVLTPAMTEGMEERAAELTKVLIDDCGHWTQQEQPEATNDALIGWLDTLPRWR